ncbi:EamA family transporter [[Clostridium] innocuum]|nr:EamA family transporter [[Clostridium] innocuum]
MYTKGILYTVLSAVLFGITPLITTAVYGYGANSMTVVFYRSLFVIPMLAVIMKARGISFTISVRDLRNTGIIAVFGSGLTTILLFSSYAYIDVGCATTLHFLYPVFVSLLCFAVYHERLGRRKLLALGMAFVGALCFFDLTNAGSITGLIMAASSALTYAFYMVQLEKTRLSHQNAYKISFYLAIFILLETLVYHLLFSSIQFILPWNAYMLILLLSLVSSFLAVVLLQKGIQKLGSSTASLFCLFEPITSVICGVFFLQEALTPAKAAGCLIILTALIIMSREQKKKEAS